jgi:hypothetical protein
MKKLFIIFTLLLSGFVSANPFAKPSEPHAIINMGVTHSSKDVFPVSLFEIDGKQIIKRNNAVWLKPGQHSMRFKATIKMDTRSKAVTTRQKTNNPKSNNTLDINLEEGKTYYVGYDTSDRDPNHWKPVVWKVK